MRETKGMVCQTCGTDYNVPVKRRRRKLWHVLADAGAPDWLWQLATKSWWRPCKMCRRPMVHKRVSAGGGREGGVRRYCSTECHNAREGWF